MGTPSAVIILVNKRYFIEDKFLIVDCFYDQKVPNKLIIMIFVCQKYNFFLLSLSFTI